MLEEEGLNCCEDTAGSSLILENTILQFFIEEEALLPRIMEVTLTILEQKL